MLKLSRPVLAALIGGGLVLLLVAGVLIARSSSSPDTSSSDLASSVDAASDASSASTGTEWTASSAATALSASESDATSDTAEAPVSASAAPAGQDVRLASLKTPPEKTLIALPADDYEAGVRVRLEFEPYGFGPDTSGPTVVVRVISADAADSGLLGKLAGRNVVLLLGDSSVEVGGRYFGTAITRADDGRMVLVLEGAQRVEQ